MTKPPDNFPSSSPWQFGLRWFLLATAAVAGFMAWWTYQVRDLRQRREATEKIVQWQNEAISPDNFWIPDLRELTTPPVAWWLALSGEETYPLLTSLSFDVRSYDDAFVESSPIDDSHLPTIALATTLKTLKIPRAKITDAGLAALASLQELVSLDLEDTPITDEGLRHLAKLRSLERLNLSGTQVRGSGLAFLADCPLAELSLTNTPLESATLPLKPLTKLRALDISGPKLSEVGIIDHPNLQRVSIYFQSPGRVQLERLPQLSTASIHAAELLSFQVQDLSALSDLTLHCDRVASQERRECVLQSLEGLKQLKIYGRDQFALQLMTQLAELDSLEQLEIYATGQRLGDEEAQLLSGLSRLRILRIRPSSIANRGLQALPENLEQLDIETDGATVEGLQPLARLEQLRMLVLTGLRGEQDPGPALGEFKRLEELTLGDVRSRSVTLIAADDGPQPTFPSLKQFRISGPSVEKIQVTRLAKLADLNLNLPRARSFEIRRLPALTHLNVSFAQRQQIDEWAFHDLPKLGWLSLQCGDDGHVQFPEDAFDHLAAFPKMSGIICGLDLPPRAAKQLQQYGKAKGLSITLPVPRE